MSTIDSDKVSKLRAKILNVANKVIEAYTLMQEEKFDEARDILYHIKRFEIDSIRSELLNFEFGQKKEEK